MQALDLAVTMLRVHAAPFPGTLTRHWLLPGASCSGPLDHGTGSSVRQGLPAISTGLGGAGRPHFLSHGYERFPPPVLPHRSYSPLDRNRIRRALQGPVRSHSPSTRRSAVRRRLWVAHSPRSCRLPGNIRRPASRLRRFPGECRGVPRGLPRKTEQGVLSGARPCQPGYIVSPAGPPLSACSTADNNPSGAPYDAAEHQGHVGLEGPRPT
ncbi:Hypothetical protein CGLY_12600 [Corynebacterium glyciniphilum AJ 3170]|uniref:Uncharacterized protein n=1 Tax=Corynebacterium glyciniphilum AJ 3170 TaxID=1404245 RepID=X5EC34_9CORY|nr:Hypothetical protein CGLY_12600 [Corynebacterium glyciniphilum AJ 3170]